jgi:hypothetical protein
MTDQQWRMIRALADAGARDICELCPLLHSSGEPVAHAAAARRGRLAYVSDLLISRPPTRAAPPHLASRE